MWDQLLAGSKPPKTKVIKPLKREYAPGAVIGEFTLLEYIPGSKSRNGSSDRMAAKWKCRCSCGKEAEVNASNLYSGKIVSCHAKAKVSRPRVSIPFM